MRLDTFHEFVNVVQKVQRLVLVPLISLLKSEFKNVFFTVL
uniref:Uncharacterized protein n=1 Tax=Anguilla anguilla TaxID=7936 RepID=A0A0E9XCV9_ANGAN